MNHFPGAHAPTVVRAVRRSSGTARRPASAGGTAPEPRSGPPRAP